MKNCELCEVKDKLIAKMEELINKQTKAIASATTFIKNFNKVFDSFNYGSTGSHFHCWNQKSPACGQPIPNHEQCCLCDTLNPTK